MIRLPRLFLMLVSTLLLSNVCYARDVAQGAAVGELQATPPTAAAPTPIVVRDCAECPELVKVDGAGHEGKTLFVGRYELLWREYYLSVTEAGCPAPTNPAYSSFPDPGPPNPDDRYPITSIRPTDIQCYLSWVSKKTGKTYRLPTEQGWVRIAVLSGVTEQDTVENYPRSKAFLRDMSNEFIGMTSAECNSLGNNPGDKRESARLCGMAPVGLKGADRLGLYDLIGNLPELIADLPDGVPSIALNMRVVATKGAGVRTSKADFNLLRGNTSYFAELTGQGYGFRVIREE